MTISGLTNAELPTSVEAITEIVCDGRYYQRLDRIAGPMTDRTAEMLARMYGFMGVIALSDSVPEGARVLDVGAGLSNLGHRITATRPDITWINFDLRYRMKKLRPEDARDLVVLQSEAPENLTYLAGSVFHMPPELNSRSFDVGLSYYMFTHIINNYGFELSRTAMLNILGLIKPGGVFRTGPNKYNDSAWSTVIDTHDPDLLKEMATDLVEAYNESWEDCMKRHKRGRSLIQPVTLAHS